MWPLLSLVFVSQAFTGDAATGTESFLLERPVSRRRVWLARFCASVASTGALAAVTGAVVLSVAAATVGIEAIGARPAWVLAGAGLLITAVVVAAGFAAASFLRSPVGVVLLALIIAVSVRELLNANRHLAPAQAVDILRQTLLALEHAHAKGFVHRDLKPENILLTADGVVKLTDLGLARAFADAKNTRAGAVTGTVQYLAPEQIRGEPADPRSNPYSLGIVTFELLTGRLPFTGETPMSIAYKHLSDDVPAPSGFADDVPADLDAFVAAAVESGEIQILSLDGGATRALPGSGPNDLPDRWSADGRRLFVLDPSGLPARVSTVEVASGRRELWGELVPVDLVGVSGVETVALTPDATAYVYSFRQYRSDLYRGKGLR